MKIVNYMFLEGKMELYYVWLECIKGFGPVAWHDFLWEYGDPEMIYRKLQIASLNVHLCHIRRTARDIISGQERTH